MSIAFGFLAIGSVNKVIQWFSVIVTCCHLCALQEDETANDDEELSVDNTSVMRGLFDIISIIWTGFSKELNMVVPLYFISMIIFLEASRILLIYPYLY